MPRNPNTTSKPRLQAAERPSDQAPSASSSITFSEEFTYSGKTYRIKNLPPLPSGKPQRVLQSKVAARTAYPKEKPGPEYDSSADAERADRQLKSSRGAGAVRLIPEHWHRLKTGSLKYDEIMHHYELLLKRRAKEAHQAMLERRGILLADPAPQPDDIGTLRPAPVEKPPYRLVDPVLPTSD